MSGQRSEYIFDTAKDLFVKKLIENIVIEERVNYRECKREVLFFFEGEHFLTLKND